MTLSLKINLNTVALLCSLLISVSLAVKWGSLYLPSLPNGVVLCSNAKSFMKSLSSLLKSTPNMMLLWLAVDEDVRVCYDVCSALHTAFDK